jgi:CrcB protein
MWAFLLERIKMVSKNKTYIQRDSHPELPINPDVVKEGEYKWPPHFRLILILYVFIGGCFGAFARYGVIENLPTLANGWPLATTFTNLLGAFALGMLLEGLSRLGEDGGTLRVTRLVLGTGFIGAFTTYSTFVVDTHSLIATGNMVTVVWYVLSTLIGGLILCGLGIRIAAIHHQRGLNR